MGKPASMLALRAKREYQQIKISTYQRIQNTQVAAAIMLIAVHPRCAAATSPQMQQAQEEKTA
jgi:hypothetical protein